MSSDHRKIRDHEWRYRFLFHVLKLNRTPTFLERLLFAPEACINEPKHAKRRAVVRLRLNDFFLPCTGCSEGGARFFGVVRHASDDAFHDGPT